MQEERASLIMRFQHGEIHFNGLTNRPSKVFHNNKQNVTEFFVISKSHANIPLFIHPNASLIEMQLLL